MSEPAGAVADGAQAPLKVVSETRYEASPPANLDPQHLVDPDGAVATTKEEEWVTKKKTELTTTRQIETRVKRQVLVEDGKVVEDSGPIVTTNTTEDTETQETHQTERRTPGADDDGVPEGEWTVSAGPGGLVKEVKEKVVKSREKKEERIETEDVMHLGDIAEEDYVTAVRNKQDVRQLLLEKAEGKGGELVSLKDTCRVLHQSSKSHKVIDTKDSHKVSAVGPDGRVITETKTTTEHEEVRDQEEPDDGDAADGEEEEVHETKNESSHRFHKSKDQELVEYLADGVKIGEEMRYQAENVEGERQGDPEAEWDSLSTRIRRMRRQGNRGITPAAAGAGAAATPLDRKDALTRRPLDFDQEEETRKVETSKWLEHHFGSDSRSSKDSLIDEDDPPAPPTGSKTSFINVTMKSRPITSPVTNGGPSPPPGYVATTVNTSSRVFVSSPEPDEPVASPPQVNGYFKGVSDWTERRNEVRGVFPTTPHRPERVQVLPTGPNHTFKPREEVLTSPHGSSDNLDRVASPGHVRTTVYHTNSNTSTDRASSQQRLERGASPFHVHDRVSPHHRDSPTRVTYPYNGTREDDEGYPAPPRRRYVDRVERVEDEASYHQEDYRAHWEHARSRPEDPEPPPDYSPPPAATPSPSPPPEPSKKVYQRTRFAADIPPPTSRSGSGGGGGPSPPATASKGGGGGGSGSKGSFIGDSFRRLVGRLRSSSAERKARKKNRSPSPLQQSSTYQQYHVIDNNLPSAAPHRPARSGHHQSASHSRERATQTRHRTEEEEPPQTQDAMDRGQHQRNGRVVQRYYLGEDPFGGSIYGREKEYDGVVPARSRRHRQHSNSSREDAAAPAAPATATANVNRVSSSTLGRLSKSTSRLVSDSPPQPAGDGEPGYTRSAQTLPRKLLYEKRQQQQQQHSSQWQHRTSPGLSKSPHSSSLINVSIINNVTPAAGPAKPARTYRANLARSKSFNVHAAGEPSPPAQPRHQPSTVYKSNPQLHRLDESPPPLKSPGILASISRSQRDLTDSAREDDGRRHLVNGGGHDAKKRLFMRGLMDRAPELFKKLHGDEEAADVRSPTGRLFTSTPTKNGFSSRVVDYSESFHSSSTNATPPDGEAYKRSSPFRQSVVNGGDRVVSPSFLRDQNGGTTTKSVIRKGSPGTNDFSETVRITSKSEDPIRPSVTNTVQSFTKKTIPTKGGLSTETIESSETTTVTKSRVRAGEPARYQENGFGKYGGLRNGSGGGVVIEVRPSRK